jgi:hypothetical protein
MENYFLQVSDVGIQVTRMNRDLSQDDEADVARRRGSSPAFRSGRTGTKTRKLAD